MLSCFKKSTGFAGSLSQLPIKRRQRHAVSHGDFEVRRVVRREAVVTGERDKFARHRLRVIRLDSQFREGGEGFHDSLMGKPLSPLGANESIRNFVFPQRRNDGRVGSQTA